MNNKADKVIEAIETLESMICVECTTEDIEYTDEQADYIEGIEMAIEALKRQMPKTPNLIADGYYEAEIEYGAWTCPTCGEYYKIEDEEYEYCPRCGQRIAW